jgi:hypothetical protein
METHIEPRVTRVLQSSESAQIRFIFTEFTAGLTSCSIAKKRRNLGLDAFWQIRQAERALSAANKSMLRFRNRYPGLTR